MANVTRRGFIVKTSTGVATIGALLAAPGLGQAAEMWAAPEMAASDGKFSGPIVAHVRNASTGEVAVMSGTREFVFHDRKLVARLIRAAR